MNENLENDVINENDNEGYASNINDVKNETKLENSSEQKLFREVIEKKPSGFSKKAIALLVAFALMLGTAFGFGLNNLMLGSYSGLSGGNGKATDYVISKTVSPVVPISKKVLPSIVAIKVKAQVTNMFGNKVNAQGTGSGIIIDDQGHIVTNNHVVEGASELVVVLMDGKELPAQLIGRDPVSDLAVIKVDQKGLPFAEFGDSDQVEVGELAIALGSPMGTDFASSVTAGIISGLNRQVSVGDRTMDLIQTDAAINPGNSGGALVNSEGKVIGINVLKLSESSVEGMGFSIPINEAKPIIDQLIKEKKIIYPSLGISGSTISKDDAKTYSLPQGVYVQTVIPNSGAEKAGMKQGDIIIEVDGTKVLTIEEVVSIVTKHKVGDIIKVSITNQYNKISSVDVTLSERPVQ